MLFRSGGGVLGGGTAAGGGGGDGAELWWCVLRSTEELAAALEGGGARNMLQTQQAIRAFQRATSPKLPRLGEVGHLLASRLEALVEDADLSQQGQSQQGLSQGLSQQGPSQNLSHGLSQQGTSPGPSHDFLSTPLLAHGLAHVPSGSTGWDDEQLSVNARLVLDMFRHATSLHAPRTPPPPTPAGTLFGAPPDEETVGYRLGSV